MKALALLIALLMTHQAMAGLPPTTLSGQAQTVKPTTFTFKTPNNQSTKVSGVESLIETGNMNLLANPGFEHSTYDTSWTCTGTGTESAEASTLIAGKKALKIVTSAQTVDCLQDSTLYASQLAGMQGYVQVWGSNTAAGVQICPRAAGSDGTDCITMATDGLWKAYEIPVVLSATSNGIKIKATSTTGTTILDEAYVGLISGKTPEVSQAQIAGESYFAATASCTWARTSASIGAFTSTAACPGPTISYSSIGSWQTTDSDLPRQTINSAPAGIYEVTVIHPVVTNSTASATTNVAISDGTTTCVASPSTWGSTTSGGSSSSCVFVYTQQADRFFEVYGSNTSGTITLNNVNSSLKFIVTYYPPSSKIYSQAGLGWFIDANIGGANLNPTVSTAYLAWENASLDMVLNTGSATARIPCSSTNTASGLTCSAGSEQLGVNFTPPKPGYYEACIYYSQYTQAGASVFSQWILTPNNAQTITTNGQTRIGAVNSASQTGGAVTNCAIFYFSDASEKTLRYAYEADLTGTQILADRLATAGQRDVRITVKPAVNDQVITGTFAEMVKAPGISKPVSGFAIVNTAGTFVLQLGDDIFDSLANIATGRVTVNLDSTKITDAVCVCTAHAASQTTGNPRNCDVTSYTATQYNLRSHVPSVGNTTGDLFVFCGGRAP